MAARQTNSSAVRKDGKYVDLSVYSFLAESDGTVAGYYVDDNGIQIGSGWTQDITSGTAFTFMSLTNPPPAEAVGWMGRMTMSVRVGRNGQPDGTISQNPTSAIYYQQLASESLVYGKVIG